MRQPHLLVACLEGCPILSRPLLPLNGKLNEGGRREVLLDAHDPCMQCMGSVCEGSCWDEGGISALDLHLNAPTDEAEMSALRWKLPTREYRPCRNHLVYPPLSTGGNSGA